MGLLLCPAENADAKGVRVNQVSRWSGQIHHWDALLTRHGSVTFRVSRRTLTSALVVLGIVLAVLALGMLFFLAVPDAPPANWPITFGLVGAMNAVVFVFILRRRLRPPGLTVTAEGFTVDHQGSERWTEVERVYYSGTHRSREVSIRRVKGRRPRTFGVARTVPVNQVALAEWLGILHKRATGNRTS